MPLEAGGVSQVGAAKGIPLEKGKPTNHNVLPTKDAYSNSEKDKSSGGKARHFSQGQKVIRF